ncbi:MAG TPA: DUF998 domain-containing protein [Candidatus Dormibacteraeota bacterium]|nr:DUF998 domain-containing protein [Candidatus Dormibacteraeota bacterium]
MHVFRRAGGLAALAAPTLMWTEFLTHGISRQGYDLLTRPFSDLATLGTPNSVQFDVGFFLVPGVLTVVVGFALWFATHEGGPAWRIGSTLIIAAGVFLFATGIFRQETGSFAANILHGTMSQIGFATASVAPLVLFIGSTAHTQLGPPRRLWLLAGLAAVAIEGIGVAMRPITAYPDGFFQRPFTVVLTVWFVATGIWLLRLRQVPATR